MSPERFNHLLSLVEDSIKCDTNFRKSISPAERLYITLRFLASGDSQQSLTYLFRVGAVTVSRIVSETYKAIYVLSPTYLSAPKSSSDWLRIAAGFEEQWNFPHVLDAIDGKHINIK